MRSLTGADIHGPRSVDVTGSAETSSPAPPLCRRRLRAGLPPGLGDSSSRVFAAPSFAPSLPGLRSLTFLLLLRMVNFHSGLLWEKSHSRLLSFSLLSKRKGKTNLDFLSFF